RRSGRHCRGTAATTHGNWTSVDGVRRARTIFLCKGRHHTSGIEEGHVDSCPITKSKLTTDQAVLDEPRPVSFDDHIHAEPARLEAALGPDLVQPRQGGRGHHGKGKNIEEGTDGDRGLHSKHGEECRPELLRDNRVSVAPRVCALYVWVVLVDGEVIRRDPRQCDVSSKVC